ncbi:Class I SAM-dependent methyltransferase [Sulfidibacter corallicola]|uniref:Class I SAM-dependent methyltransferase n=1 Tax=Sulfidibacter corallicola TaxID=2818388 RepID=A0A8A4TFW7_SULCO|nr:class I SAM-dependent methyltransferase [Sulfidibacter corallicola]QTD48082.1 class I SAM-dependent methyltransferase [Sulfidibacter corallicola]
MNGVEYGKTSSEYVRYRVGFPQVTFDRLASHQIGLTGQNILDFGAGTGTLTRGFAQRGCQVTALEPSAAHIAAARNIAEFEGLRINWVQGDPTATNMPSNYFDAVTAGQCWHLLDRPNAAREVNRVLKRGGQLAIAHFDWLNLPGSVVEATENLIEAFNPMQPKPHIVYGGGVGIYGTWTLDVAKAGFGYLETFSFDVVVPYTPEAWRGRIRATHGVTGTMSKDQTIRFDLSLKGLLELKYADQMLEIPHRVWVLVCTKE